jgi:hypothetical protein
MAQAITNHFDIENLPIAELRRTAAVMKIAHQKDWDKETFIAAINSRRKKAALVRIVTDETEEIPVGYVRMRLPLLPNGSECPLDVRINNFYTMIPRNVVVDVPNEVRDTIRQSTEVVTRKVIDKEGHDAYKTMEVPCYQFEVLGETKGVSGAVKPSGDIREQRLREQYKNIYGRYARRQSVEWKSFHGEFMKAYNDKKAKQAVDDEVNTALEES